MTPAPQTRDLEPLVLPRLKSHFSFGRWQLVGLAFLVLIPVLAAFQVLGEGRKSVSHRTRGISITVDYPSRVHYGTPERISVLVTNIGTSSLDTLTVGFDSSYIARFSDPQFVPSAIGAYIVDLADVIPGEVVRVQLSLRAKDYGRHRGRIAASHAGDTARVSITTFVFP